jgi:hypothetical protein
VLVAPDLATELDVDPRFALQRIRPRRLKGIGVVTLSQLEWAEPPEPGSAGSRLMRPRAGRQPKRSARER